MAVDLVMWVYNGEHTLKAVLDRINSVIPEGQVNQKIVVDDGSTDNSRSIAMSCGWQVVNNFGKGIGDGANTALKHVETEYFVSFEQDVLVAPDWWNKVALPTIQHKYAVGSGIRYNSKPKGVINLLKYTEEKHRNKSLDNSKSRKFLGIGKTLDNTIYNTAIIRSLGGFPNFGANAGIDLVLAWNVIAHDYNWYVNFDAVSIHLRTGLFDELRHQRWYGMQRSIINDELKRRGVKENIPKMRVVSHLFAPPIQGLAAALKTRDATICYIYPLIRFFYVWGVLTEGRLNN